MTPRGAVASPLILDNNEMDDCVASAIANARKAQIVWAAKPIVDRLRMLRKFRHAVAGASRDLASTVPAQLPGNLHRALVDTLVAEVLPLAEACRFLEREAVSILAPYRPGNRLRPFWLRAVSTEIHREPIGVILIIGPGNYPLFLPGAQALQALAAGNAVLWKPAPGGGEAARAMRLLLLSEGMDPSLLQILDESPETAIRAIQAGVDKTFLTGSAATGRAVMHHLAETLTPSVMELSGCDAVFILDDADIDRAVAALAFGMRLNGSATCMAPRRIFVTKAVANRLIGPLATALDLLEPVGVPSAIHDRLLDLMADAEAKGATFERNGLDAAHGNASGCVEIRPTLLTQVNPEMRIARTDIFAPVLAVIEVVGEEEALAANAGCPYALTVSIFGPEKRACRLGAKIQAGNILINDIIVSTADPRVPFGGRKQSGFGATRGREGLLEMTAIKTIQTQRARDIRAYAPPTPHHESFIAGYLRMAHSDDLRKRWNGAKEFFSAMMKIK